MLTGKWVPLPFILVVSLLAGCIEVDMSVPSFPDMAASFGVSEGHIQRTITYNFLGFVFGALIYGPLSESIGRRKTMLFGGAIMLLGALGCTYATSIDLLMLSRFIQGVGACTPVVVAYAIIADRYQGAAMYSMIGLVNACISIFMSLAPIAGGWINEHWGWRGNYAVVAVITAAAVLLELLFLPETKKEKTPFDLKAIVGSYARLTASFQFMRLSLIPSLFFAAYMVFIASSAFLYRETFAFSLSAFVVHFFIIVASFSIPSLFSARIIAAFGGDRRAEKIGMALAIVSILALLTATTPWAITLLMSLFCFGFSICYPTLFARSMSVYPEIYGVAASYIMSMRSLLVVAITGMASYVFIGRPEEMSYVMASVIGVVVLLSMLSIVASPSKAEE
ncbi:MFS transporter [Serratia marcescens]|uniref:MFS transporter n=1 Tax=Serratia marcescens TaxID=615 RepID=UPI003204D4C7